MLSILTLPNVAVFVLTLLAVWFINTIFQRRRLPPGPFPLPVVGNFLDLKQYATIVDFVKHNRQKYGKIFHWKAGQNTVVHLCDLKLIQEAFVKNAAVMSHRATRATPIGRYAIKEYGGGLANNDGPQWKELRKISLTAMRDLGVGKKSLEEKILDEVNFIVNYINQQEGKPHCYKPLMVKATSNVICNIVFGDRFDYEDPKFLELLNLVNKLFGNPNGLLANPANSIPFLLPIMMAVRGKPHSFGALEKTLEHIQQLSKEHEKTFDAENIRDFVDLTLKYRKEKAGQTFNERNMQRLIVDFFIAGSDTTANALFWGMLYMAAFPEIQKKCQDEIDAVVGKGRPVSLTDRSDLKYCEATIMETLRMGIVAPFSVPHYSIEDVNVGGYLIPKNSIVQASIFLVSRDPDVWENPEKFEPRRFLDDNNNIINRERLINFSVGPRSCVGEILSKMEMSLIFPSILQHYNIRPESDSRPVDLEPFQGLTTQGKDQGLVLTKR